MLTSAVTHLWRRFGTVDSKARVSGGSIFFGKLLTWMGLKNGFLEFSWI